MKTFEEKYMTPLMKAKKEEKENLMRRKIPQNLEDPEELKEI